MPAIGSKRIDNRSLIYTGIGSRQTPEPILRIMTLLAQELVKRGWMLRSGGSPGADTAFEKGCDLAGGRKEIYLPWRGFNQSESPLFATPSEAMTIALRVHPDLRKRSWRVRKLRTRNVCQLLGRSLNEPSDVVIAWTKGGVPSGGSATVLQLAQHHRIPSFNIGLPEFSGLGCDAILAAVLRASSSNH